MKKILLLVLISALTVSCSVTRLQKGEHYVGSTMDLLQSDQTISATIIDDKLKVQIMAGKQKCIGHFTFKDSDKSYLGFTIASNNYVGKFAKAKGACKKALGNKGNKEIEVQVARLGGMLGTSIMSTTAIRICEDAEGVCFPKNTFKVEKQ